MVYRLHLLRCCHWVYLFQIWHSRSSIQPPTEERMLGLNRNSGQK